MGSSLADPAYEKAIFSGRAENVRLFSAAVLDRLGAAAMDVIEIGCGTGDLVFALEALRPQWRMRGLDISTVNISTAASRGRADRKSDAPQFVAADYLSWPTMPVDVLLSDGVLHLVAGDDDELAAKLARDLRPGGLLIMTMPDDGIDNRLRLVLRRLWSRLPRAFDHLAVAMAGIIYPREPKSLLRERASYLRILPPRLFSDALARHLSAQGLLLIEDGPWPNSSALKLRHRFFMLQRGAAALER